jgi:HK97 family phage major capsid protein
MNLSEQIKALLRQRTALLDAMRALTDKAVTGEGDAAEPRLFTEEEQKEFDKIERDVADIDAQVVRLKAAEAAQAAAARPANHPLIPAQDIAARTFKPFPGQAFTRFVSACALSKGNLLQALEIAKRWANETPEVIAVLNHAVRVGNTNEDSWVQRAAVAPGTTTDPIWAQPLVNYQIMTQEFIELLRPLTIFGRLDFRRVPFNIKIPRQTGGSSGNWVGEGQSKPVSSLAFDMVTLPWAKIAVIVVITIELARFSDPSAEMLVRDDMLAAIAEFIDTQMWDPAVAPAVGIRPGALTNGAHSVASTGNSIAALTADLTAAMLWMTQPPNNLPMIRPVWIMNAATAMQIATMRTAQDIFAFPSMSAGGAVGTLGSTPTLMGIPVVTGPHIANGTIILCEQSQVFLADDGQTTIDTSAEASVQMDSAPDTPPTPLVSFWQQNLLGIKAERFIYWMRRRDQAVYVITGLAPPAAP